MNDHEVHAECVRLLREGLPEPTAAGFDDGRGFLPLCLDVDGDIAVVTFLRRPGGVSGGLPPFIEGWMFHRRDGEWMELGGAGGSAFDEPLARRSAAELGGRHLQRYGTGRTVRNANRLLPWGAKWVSQARLRVAAEASHLRVGNRMLEVPAHGHTVVVWGARRAPVVEALALDGAILDALDLDYTLARA
ncbi:hypothetical protein [Actinomadura rugatobispora]|uniref:Uncharacterized protein n=1 Tax=Actinomadura rugatobispora TaxID=1994 RepID=A0ABW1A521_9ACTN|nr:hypothetical protein GCM10010200_013540 [Actinomadura rugatobispora]